MPFPFMILFVLGAALMIVSWCMPPAKEQWKSRPSLRQSLCLLGLVCASFAGGAGLASAGGSDSGQAQELMTVGVQAERAAFRHYGRFTGSVADLEVISPTLRDLMRDDTNSLRLDVGSLTGSLRIVAVHGRQTTSILLLKPAG